ncbi:DNA repair protein RadC [Variovorax boronicumulans]|uniref:DNA repair protein RadC n=1 Tax=Variovorax boronicumulans TaxID=436515 RepID=A0AAW8DAD3_9BURK|nr:DNA repair protein RadC [Variovorax boronicumulans]MDP9896330.1 DNA repair protein RadC [Variovorax boronicumulans]MDQ0056360.1 DNA repair protein RadC [Variovorax boronicumulans]
MNASSSPSSSSCSSSFMSSSSAGEAAGMLSSRDLRVLEALRPFLGAEAEALFEVHGRSLHRLIGFARDTSGIGWLQMLSGLRLARELLMEDLRPSQVFRSAYAVSDYLKLHFAGQAHESFAVLFLNAQHTMLAFEDMFRGTLTQADVYPREVVKRALQLNASAVILAHNHPSGKVEPSEADVAVTRVLKDALALVDVQVLDHIVVGHNRAASMAECGLL